MNWSKERLLKQAREETKSAVEYRKAGYPGIARDEARHAAFMRLMASKKR